MLKHRLIFGTLMIAGLIAVFYFDNRLDEIDVQGTLGRWTGRDYLPAGLLMLGVMCMMIVLATRELRDIFAIKGIPANWFMLAVSGLCGCLMIYIIPQQTNAPDTMAAMCSVMLAIFMLSLFQYSWAHQRTEGAVAVASAVMFAFLYMGVMPGFFVAIRRWDSAWIVAAIILITKSCDIGAYFTGRAIGKRKLIPWLSPGKTWEGLFGGLLFAGIVASLLAWLNNATAEYELIVRYERIGGQRVATPYHFELWKAFGAGMIFGLVGQVGDLTASIFKRDAGIKDSGRTIPGYGGMIDVIDSPILVAPAAYWLMTLP